VNQNSSGGSDQTSDANASVQLTRFRVLSGRHAGASIDLVNESYTLGANDEFEIYIGDWDAQNIRLEIGVNGVVQARWREASKPTLSIADSVLENDEHVLVFKEIEPVRFGSIIVCIGACTATWPSDADILQKFYSAKPVVSEAESDSRHRLGGTWRKYMTISAVVLVSFGGALKLSNSFSVNAALKPTMPQVPLIERVKEALIFVGASRLSAKQNGTLITVDGLLDTREQVSRVRQKLSGLGANAQIMQNYRSADDIANMIRESLSAYSVQVKHLREKLFVVEGNVADPAKVKAILAGIQADLAGLGIKINAEIKAIGPKLNEGVTAVLVDDFGTSYTQTRDGVKHLVLKATNGYGSDATLNPAASAEVE
jgi:type III secretion protein D